MKSNNAEDDRQVHALVFLRMSNTNENEKLLNILGGWDTVAKKKKSYRNESLWRYTRETQQGRLLAQNFS